MRAMDRAREQLNAYGYTLVGVGEIAKGNKKLGVFVSTKGNRQYARTVSGALLWSGNDIGVFVAKFWYAERVA